MPGTIVSTRELARTFENEVRVGGTAKRRWVCMLSDDVLTAGGPPGISDILSPTAGGSWGVAHPVHTALGLRKISVNERFEDNPYAIEVIGEYGLLTVEDSLAPTSRPAVWSFEARKGEFPALFYYDGSGNSVRSPLTNSAYDYFPGLMTTESLITAKVTQNFTTFPYNWTAANNFVNNATYLGGAAHTVRCDGVDVSRVYEEWNNANVAYWTATANLVYRESSHNLLLPDVGFNFIDGTEKRRAMVFDWKNAEWVASPNPVGLDGSGGQTLGAPAILTRRVHPEANFAFIFGTPPA